MMHSFLPLSFPNGNSPKNTGCVKTGRSAWMALPAVAALLRGAFPGCLHGARPVQASRLSDTCMEHARYRRGGSG